MCQERIRLVADYRETTHTYADFVRKMTDLVGLGIETEVDLLRRSCKMSWEAAAEKARLALFRHEAETKPAFSDAIARGRDKADAEIAHSLYQRALGYSHEAVKIFIDRHGDPVIVPYIEHYPPDTNAASLWLRNRHGARWRDKIEANVTGTLTLEALVNAALAPPAPEPPTIEHDPELQADDTDALKPQ